MADDTRETTGSGTGLGSASTGLEGQPADVRGAATERLHTTRDALKEGITAAGEVGATLAASTTNVAKVAITGVTDIGGDIVTAAGVTMKEAMSDAAEIGSDAAVVARSAANGLLDATREIGGKVEEVATVLAKGAIETAGSVGMTAVGTVKDLLCGVVEGVKDVAGSAMVKKSEKTS